jgi:pimeloyl-ACP methyl ester carboxylesterase
MAETSIGPAAPASTEPVRDDVLTLNGLRFHYRDWGSPEAPPLVLLHGFTGNAGHGDTVARAMADRYRVLALDQRGHGESDWAPDQNYLAATVNEDFAAFVAALQLGRFAIVGFSFGGHVAFSYAAAHPDRVERLVLVESSAGPSTPAFDAHIAAMKGLPWEFNTPDEAVRSFAAAGLAPFAPEQELRHWVETGLKQQPDDSWTWRLDPVMWQGGSSVHLTQTEDVMWRLLPRVTCPTLLVRGAETMAFPLDRAERMAAVMPDARVASLPRAGHWPALDNPIGFVQVVRNFLAEA